MVAISSIHRRPTVAVQVGHIQVGGGAPVVVQSMTNTNTEDAKSTAAQVLELANAGSELVRITVNTEAAAQAVPEIRRLLDAAGCNVPLIGDFHYNGHRLLNQYPECAEVLAKYRINPGNVGFGEKHDTQFAQIIEVALKYNKPVRIGVNWGSLDPDLSTRLMDENAKSSQPVSAAEITREALIQSALLSAAYAEKLGMSRDKIILACKVSSVRDLIAVYKELAARTNHALHLGLTEAGMSSKGIVATAAALATLLLDGIGDTIRASLTPEPGGDRTREVQVCQEILQTLDLRSFVPMVAACPGCGRTTSTYYQELAEKVQGYVRDKMPVWREQYEGVENMTLAVMGCIVNGPGESKHANIGISLPGTGENPIAPVFIDGVKAATLRGEGIFDEFRQLVDTYVAEKYPLRS